MNKIFAGKKQNAKNLKSVQNVLDNPDPAWAKMISNPAPDPKNLIIPPDRTPKIRIRNNTDANQGWWTETCNPVLPDGCKPKPAKWCYENRDEHWTGLGLDPGYAEFCW